jgi:hypothetical protein
MKIDFIVSAKCESEEERQRCKEAGSNPQFGRWWCYWLPHIEINLKYGWVYKYEINISWLIFLVTINSPYDRQELEKIYLT